MTRNDILQILVFSLFFGAGLGALKHDTRVKVLVDGIDGMVPVMLWRLITSCAPLRLAYLVQSHRR